MLSLPLARKHRPVAFLLNALVLACLLPGLIGITLFVFAEYREERQRLTENNIDSARTLGQAIDGHILRTQALAQSLAGAGELSSDNLAMFTKRAARAIAAAGLGEQVIVFKIDHDQLVGIASSEDIFVPSRSNTEAAWRVFRQGMAIISDVVTDPVSGRSVVSTHVPVVIDGKVEYAVAVAIPSDQLTAILREYNLPNGWLASLVDRRGVIAARSRGSAKLVGQLANVQLRNAIARSPTGALETVSLDGIENFTAFSRSVRTGYTTVVGVPQAQLVRPLLDKLAYLSATVALLFALGLLLARYAGGLIANSIQALIKPAIALGQGTPLAIAPVHLSEAAELGTAIERAAGVLEQRDAALRAQKEDLQQFKFFSEHSNEMLLLLDDQGNIRYANQMASRRLGYSTAELMSMMIYRIDLAATPERLLDVFDASRAAPLPTLERVYQCSDGTEFPVEITATVLEHRGEWFMHVAPRDIGERKQAEQAVRWAATHDALTGLANRTLALEFLGQVLFSTWAGDASDPGGALLYIDVDRFKPVNDLYGHEVGDRVLQEVARRVQGCMGQEDLMARVGGDEFMAVLPNQGGAGRYVEDTVAAIIQAVSQPITLGNIEVNLSACIGISRFPEHGDAASELVHAADIAMLHVKHNGRGTFAFYCPEMDTRAQSILNVERRLQNALDNGGLALHYQPIIDMASGIVLGVEALVRLEDGIEPPLGPAAFIPVAEACGLIAPLGEWVVREACRQQVSWEAMGISLSVSVNVSALQFQRTNFSDHIRELIASSGIDPRCLVIELTETALMESLAEAVEILNQLKALGVRVALDDFGTGYSSLSMLSALPLDKLKIDQSFVRGIGVDHASRAVIDAVIALATSLNLELVAEGIETEAALRYLQERGCHQAQGYYFSRPLPVPQLLAWYAQHRPQSLGPAPARGPAERRLGLLPLSQADLLRAD